MFNTLTHTRAQILSWGATSSKHESHLILHFGTEQEWRKGWIHAALLRPAASRNPAITLC